MLVVLVDGKEGRLGVEGVEDRLDLCRVRVRVRVRVRARG